MDVAKPYQVLARKWRPQTFADVSGQEHVVRTLINAVGQGRVAHAYLFSGPRGVGKTTAARLLARALNCRSGPTSEPCGTCEACTEIAAGVSIDVPEIDGASNNGVDDVRAIRENARYVPTRDRFKIYIIDEVHMLSQAAFNALLKTLEEPPPHVKFIFATTEAHKVPETIASRCQLHVFRRIPLAQIRDRLGAIARSEGFHIGEDALTLIAEQADGGMRDALSLLDQVICACGDELTAERVADVLGAVDRRAVMALARALIERDAAAVVGVLAEQDNRGTEARRVCESLCRQLRHLLVCRLSGKAPAELPDHEQKELEQLAKRADPAQLTRLFELSHEALGELGRMFDPRLGLEVALLKGVYLAPGGSIAELLARAEALAASSGTTPAPARVPTVPTAPPVPEPQRQLDAPGQPTIAPAPPSAPAPTSTATAASEPAPAVPALTSPAALTEVSFATAAAAVFRNAPRLGSALKNGRLRALGAGSLTLAYAPGDFRAAQLSAERAQVESLLARELGGTVQLQLVEGIAPTDPPSLAEKESQGEAARLDRVREAALAAPAVRDAIRILGGTVEEVRIARRSKG